MDAKIKKNVNRVMHEFIPTEAYVLELTYAKIQSHMKSTIQKGTNTTGQEASIVPSNLSATRSGIDVNNAIKSTMNKNVPKVGFAKSLARF